MKIPDYLDKLFKPGKISEGYTVEKVETVAELILPTGKIVACDPFVFTETPPFSQTIAPGKYPVTLSTINGRIYAAKLEIKKSEPVRWVMATLPNQDVAKLKEDEIFGYPVDGGSGSFMDESTAKIINSDADKYSDELLDYEDWMSLIVESNSGANIVVFSSGIGDGLYASWWGYDKNDELVCLVTDFLGMYF